MILVNQNNFLTYNNKIYKCSLGLNGLNKTKKEGDKSTPIGIFSLGNLFVRTDRIKNLKTNFHYISIEKTMAWSDDPNSKDYNKLIKVNSDHREIMFRNDHIYDLILVINYNMHPIIPNKGSAIFIHISKDNNTPTQGCVALNLDDFREILITLKPSDKIRIN
jgi:L,D-peptidoglycan transpeptidase YkuD (ErfK/YbiS/YcfS/YnhG family)